MKLNKYIDHTILKADATKNEIINIVNEAKELDTYSVCVNGCYTSFVKELLEGSDIKVCTVIGFPLGQSSTETKVFETKNAIDNGADEIDMVINIAKLKDGEFDYVTEEIKQIKKVVGPNRVLKVIIETCLLNEGEKIKACECVIKGEADFVKTSTGFSTGGATEEDIKLLKSIVKDTIKIKASGGVKDQHTAKVMIEAGADRIGASSSRKIIEG